MTMSDIAPLALAFLAGLPLGAMFFGGLWWTVRYLPTSTRPGVVLAASLTLRTSVVLGGFYLVGNGHWQRLLSCLAGFLIARVFVLWLARGADVAGSAPAQRARHAS
jgi:F1F0 ATPase subunit 2